MNKYIVLFLLLINMNGYSQENHQHITKYVYICDFQEKEHTDTLFHFYKPIYNEGDSIIFVRFKIHKVCSNNFKKGYNRYNINIKLMNRYIHFDTLLNYLKIHNNLRGKIVRVDFNENSTTPCIIDEVKVDTILIIKDKVFINYVCIINRDYSNVKKTLSPIKYLTGTISREDNTFLVEHKKLQNGYEEYNYLYRGVPGGHDSSQYKFIPHVGFSLLEYRTIYKLIKIDNNNLDDFLKSGKKVW